MSRAIFCSYPRGVDQVILNFRGIDGHDQLLMNELICGHDDMVRRQP
jgi:hypothetical protein